jgi:hypothetical protein
MVTVPDNISYHMSPCKKIRVGNVQYRNNVENLETNTFQLLKFLDFFSIKYAIFNIVGEINFSKNV